MEGGRKTKKFHRTEKVFDGSTFEIKVWTEEQMG